MDTPSANSIIVCDLCGHEFQLAKNHLREKKVTLETIENGVEVMNPVTLTFLQCPRCNKRYPVILDDESTLPLLAELREIFGKRATYAKQHKVAPLKLLRRQEKVNKKLDFRRRQLALRFDGSFYQTEEGKERLDYRYRER